MDEETVKLYKEHGAFLCTTISPALPYALFDTAVSGASEKDQYNGRIVFDGIVESAKTALANGIPVGLGNDVGCPYITQYDFWRELCYFHKYCGVSNQFALYTATLRNARLAGVGDVTGSLEVGKSEDLIVTRQNPLEDLRALQHLELVACRTRRTLTRRSFPAGKSSALPLRVPWPPTPRCCCVTKPPVPWTPTPPTPFCS